jgi:hypothetical protein
MGEDEDRCVERQAGPHRALHSRFSCPSRVAELPGPHDLATFFGQTDHTVRAFLVNLSEARGYLPQQVRGPFGFEPRTIHDDR